MRTRTTLTSPPGQAPADEAASPRGDHELYTRGLELPTEPHVRSRSRGPLTVLAVLILVAALAYGGFRLATVGQYEDPALTDVPQDAPPEGSGG